MRVSMHMPYGPVWRQQRTAATTHLSEFLSRAKKKALSHVNQLREVHFPHLATSTALERRIKRIYSDKGVYRMVRPSLCDYTCPL
jgi:hypothetical protein